MAMKETVGSLRAYFFLAGIASAGNHIVNLNVMTRTGAIGAIGVTITVVGLSLAIAYVYLGVRLKFLLVASPQQITAVLIAGAVFLGLLLLLSLLAGLRIGALIYTLIGWLITWYLYVNAKRLAREAHAPTPPTRDTAA